MFGHTEYHKYEGCGKWQRWKFQVLVVITCSGAKGKRFRSAWSCRKFEQEWRDIESLVRMPQNGSYAALVQDKHSLLYLIFGRLRLSLPGFAE